MELFLNILQSQWALYGVFCLGSFMMGLAFCLFSKQNIQQERFHLIGRGFFVFFATNLLLIFAPCLPLLNPSMHLSEDFLISVTSVLYAFTCGLFVSSLFIGLPRLLLFWIIPAIFTIICVSAQYLLVRFNIFPLDMAQLSALCIGGTLVLAAIAFHSIPSVSQKMLFRIPKIGLLTLGVYFILKTFSWIPDVNTIPLILFTLTAIFVLMAQLRFISYLAKKYQTAFEMEQQNKTALWDAAPFPILLTKLVDDSVIYMNTACQKVLGINESQQKLLKFSSYFATPEKRNELIDRTKKNQFVSNFDVELNVQNEAHNTVWITLSSRVFELNGEVLLYINFTNITDHKQTEQELFNQASTDALTGLYNRRQFLALANQALALSQRESTLFCVMMLDIDHFKNINDTYGHDVGDIVLKRLASTIQTTLRKSDIIARWGGEEFIIFLHNTSPENAITPANKLRQIVQDLTIAIPDQKINFTISVGISLSQVYDLATLQKEADIALYHSKENGRNQTTLFSPELSMPTPQQGSES